MSDPLNVLESTKIRRYDPPDSPRSVGYVEPRRVRLADEDNPLPLDCGRMLAPVDVEYEVFGELSPQRDNVVLLLHALSGDAHAAGWYRDPEALGRPWYVDRPGWWDSMVGPGKAFDTTKYCVVCSNVLGSCYGTTGPLSLNPKTGEPYRLAFPVVTIGDWVRLQERLVTYLGIEKLLAVAGGSIGGQQAIEWGLAFPDRVKSSIVLAAAPRLSAQGLAFNAVARHAIRTDPNFRDGFYDNGSAPDKGLGVARMIGHITYLSEVSMDRKFGRRLRNREEPGFDFDVDFEVESYLIHQARSFGERFDANSYLYMTKAMDYYDASAWGDGDLASAASRAKCAWLVVSFTSDWLFTPKQCREWVNALCANRVPVTYVNIESSYGHDAFLLEVDTLSKLVSDFLEGVASS